MFLGKPKWLISVHGLEAEKPLLSSGLVARLRAAIHSEKAEGEVKWALPGKREGDRSWHSFLIVRSGNKESISSRAKWIDSWGQIPRELKCPDTIALGTKPQHDFGDPPPTLKPIKPCVQDRPALLRRCSSNPVHSQAPTPHTGCYCESRPSGKRRLAGTSSLPSQPQEAWVTDTQMPAPFSLARAVSEKGQWKLETFPYWSVVVTRWPRDLNTTGGHLGCKMNTPALYTEEVSAGI